LILGQPCIGAEEDLKNATDLVRRCLTQFGYGGNVSHVSDADYRLRGDLVHAVEQRVDELYKRTVSVAEKAKPLIEKVADRLQRDRYLDGSQVRRAMTYCSILHRKAPDTRYSAPVDAERGRPDNRCRIKWSAAA
jgi:ATP-dependent Zn protease